MNHPAGVPQAVIDREFNIWLLPFADWGETNDSVTVANHLKRMIEARNTIEIDCSRVSLKAHILKTAVNMPFQHGVYARVREILELEKQNCVDLVIAFGIDPSAKKAMVRFEQGGDAIDKGNPQFDIDGKRLEKSTPEVKCDVQSGWRKDSTVSQIVKECNLIPNKNGTQTDTLGISTDAGDYMCEGMTIQLAKAERLTNKSFFVHVAHLEGIETPNSDAVRERRKQLDLLMKFISEIVPHRVRTS